MEDEQVWHLDKEKKAVQDVKVHRGDPRPALRQQEKEKGTAGRRDRRNLWIVQLKTK